MKRIVTRRDADGNLTAEVTEVDAARAPNLAFYERFAKEMAAVIAEHVEPKLAPLRARLSDIEVRGIHFQGTYQRAQDYDRGSLVVANGSLWAAIRPIGAGEAVPG